MININIDDFSYNIKNKLTIIQACFINKVDIPRFCFHEKLSIAGNCRMCLVEDENSVKPLASCAVEIRNNLAIQTNTLKVKKARESVLEFLLANHPLDCPICDQGGECDLQDQSMIFGSDRGRFYEHKRAVENKDCGPLIKTLMNRCIHCTRCVRFGNEIAGTSFFGVTGRGSKMEIGSYIEKMVNSEISGNVIDLCPVGALTSKPFAFTSRPWELKNFNSIDILDGMHSNIRVDVRGTKVMRILPRINESLNEEWITDKIRFSYDGFRRQRIYNPIVTYKGKFTKLSWLKMLFFIKNAFVEKLKFSQITTASVFSSDLTDIETTHSIKSFLNNFGFNTNLPNVPIHQNYFFNTDLKNIELTDTVLAVNCNLRITLPLINAKLRSISLNNSIPFYYLGHFSNFNFHVKNISVGEEKLINIFEGSHWLSIKKNNENSVKPLFIFGDEFSMNFSENLCKKFTNVVGEKWNGLNAVFTMQISKELNMRNSKTFSKFNFLLNYDDKMNTSLFNFYIGHHGDFNASKSNIILPSSSFIEKNSHYMNIRGMVQKTSKSLFSVGQSRKDWTIVNAIKNTLDISSLQYSNAKMMSNINNQTAILVYPYSDCYISFSPAKRNYDMSVRRSKINNFYLTDVISKSSKIMSLCSNIMKLSDYNFLNNQKVANSELFNSYFLPSLLNFAFSVKSNSKNKKKSEDIDKKDEPVITKEDDDVAVKKKLKNDTPYSDDFDYEDDSDYESNWSAFKHYIKTKIKNSGGILISVFTISPVSSRIVIYAPSESHDLPSSEIPTDLPPPSSENLYILCGILISVFIFYKIGSAIKSEYARSVSSDESLGCEEDAYDENYIENMEGPTSEGNTEEINSIV